MELVIHNAQMVLESGILQGFLCIEGGRIQQVSAGVPPLHLAGTYVDAGGLYLSPGFVDLHTHGAGGADVMDAAPEGILEMARAHMRHGTTALMPTTVAAPEDELLRCIDSFASAKAMAASGPHLLGLHLEGPYLSPGYNGAIDARHLRLPDPAEYTRLIRRANGTIRRWTIAPELPGAFTMAQNLVDEGIAPSIGHSAATYPQVQQAFAHGFLQVTHLFSAMSTITRSRGFRTGGVVESALLLDDLTVEVIADGCHLPAELLRLTYKCKGADHICLVSDSMRAAATPQERSVLGPRDGGQPVTIEQGVAMLPDGSGFGGSVATADRLVRVMHKTAGLGLVDCIKMMCATPAKMAGAVHKGKIAIGMDADLVLFDDNINIHRVWVMGRQTHTATGKGTLHGA